MRTRFDQFAKQLLERALSEVGHVETEVEVAAEVQHADVAYEPGLANPEARARLGLLGEMSTEACLFEPFHDTPGVFEVLDCLRKQLTLHRAAVLEAKRAEGAEPAAQRVLWVIAAGRPERVIAELEMSELEDWPAGFHRAGRGFRLRLVVVRELPREPRTLLLRLLGVGRVFVEAIEDLKLLSLDAWEREIALPPLAELRLTIAGDDGLRSWEEEESAMMSLPRYEKWRKRVLAEGEAIGREIGEEIGGVEGRAASLLKVLALRGFEVSEEQRARIEDCSDRMVLDRWIEQAFKAASVSEALE
jgi:hypothetical protein